MSTSLGNSRYSDSDDDFDDFDSSSESESYHQRILQKYNITTNKRELEDIDEQRHYVAVNHTLLTEINSKQATNCDKTSEPSDQSTSPEWKDLESDSGSDSWLSYQRDTGLKCVNIPDDVKFIINNTDECKAIEENYVRHFDSTCEPVVVNHKDSPKAPKKASLEDISESTKLQNETVHLIRKETYTKTNKPEEPPPTEDLQIDPLIKKIAPKKPVTEETPNEPDCSPKLDRKFNSVSPKRKSITRISLRDNRPLAISLDCQLDQSVPEPCQQKEDHDEGISSDNESKNSSKDTNQVEEPAVLLRRNTHLKQDTRPKSEAFLDSLTYLVKKEDLYQSNVSLNSACESVQSFRSESRINKTERQNSVTSEESEDVKELEPVDKRKSNFAFIRVSEPYS